jgi:hypothetical protein
MQCQYRQYRNQQAATRHFLARLSARIWLSLPGAPFTIYQGLPPAGPAAPPAAPAAAPPTAPWPLPGARGANRDTCSPSHGSYEGPQEPWIARAHAKGADSRGSPLVWAHTNNSINTVIEGLRLRTHGTIRRAVGHLQRQRGMSPCQHARLQGAVKRPTCVARLPPSIACVGCFLQACAMSAPKMCGAGAKGRVKVGASPHQRSQGAALPTNGPPDSA